MDKTSEEEILVTEAEDGSRLRKMLVEGVRGGNMEWVVSAIASGESVNLELSSEDPTVPGGSLLSLAAALGREDIVNALLQAGAHIDNGGRFGYTPLQVAVHQGNDAVVDVLLEDRPLKPNVDAKDKDGVTSLHLAARKDRDHCARALIAAGASLDATDENKRTPLHVSVLGKSTKVMKTLLEAGSNPYALNDKGFSVLHIAALAGNDEAVQNLRMMGLTGDVKDVMGLTPEEVAETWGSHSTAWLLRKMPGSSNTQLMPSAPQTLMRRSWDEYESEGEKTLKWVREGKAYLLEANTPQHRDSHYQDADGLTPLHLAAQLGLTTTVQALLNVCCSYPGAVSFTGETPLYMAQKAGHTMVARELKEITAMKDSTTPVELYRQLLFAISLKDDVKEAVKLLSLGAPLHAIEDIHTDCLVLAIMCNRPRVVKLLMAAGAPITTCTGGLSLLQVAWLTPDVTIRVKVLVTRHFLHMLQKEQHRVSSEYSVLKRGINYLLDSLKGTTPWMTKWPVEPDTDLTDLMVAAARNNCPIAATHLRLQGAMVFAKDGRGTTPLHAAIKANHTGITKVMVRDLGACLYVADSDGNLPLDLLPSNVRLQLEEEVYHREKRQLENHQEKVRDEEDKQQLKEVRETLELLFAKHLSHLGHLVRCPVEDPSDVLLTQALLVASRRGLQLLTYLVIKVGRLCINTVLDSTQDSTALQQAASHGQSVCVALLLSLGASALLSDRYGHTAAHLAAMFCHSMTYKLLKTHVSYEESVNRAGKMPAYIAYNFEKYLNRYKKSNINHQESLRFNDPGEAIKDLLREVNIREKLENLNNIVVDFNQGETKEVKEVVLKEVGAVVAQVAAINELYKGDLNLVGSSADGTRLYAPDEFDINLVVSDVKNVKVEVKELDADQAVLCGHRLTAEVKTDKPGLQGNFFMNHFYELMRTCIQTRITSDSRLSYVPPGVERTQAGVALNFSWQGEEYPLLLIGVDVVPVLRVPWPPQVTRPPLTPNSVQHVFLTNIVSGEWRFSLAGAEAQVLEGLTWEERRVYLSCKTLLSYLKAESWMPRSVKASYSWWDSRKWKLTTPAGFGVKNCFLKQLELKRAGKLDWPTDQLAAIVAILRGMCNDFKDPTNGVEFLVPVKVFSYFGGDFEKPKFGAGAPDIIKVLEDEAAAEAGACSN